MGWRPLRSRRQQRPQPGRRDRKSTRLNSSHVKTSYAVFCLKKQQPTLRGRRSRPPRPRTCSSLFPAGSGTFECGRSSFFFNDTATTEIYTLSLHDALPIPAWPTPRSSAISPRSPTARSAWTPASTRSRSEEHTSELQSRENLVCRLLLEKKKKKQRQRNAQKQKKHKKE